MTKNHPSSLPWITHAFRSMSACLNSISLAWTISSNSENVYCNHNNKTFGCKCSRGRNESTQAQRSVCIGTQPASQSTNMLSSNHTLFCTPAILTYSNVNDIQLQTLPSTELALILSLWLLRLLFNTWCFNRVCTVFTGCGLSTG